MGWRAAGHAIGCDTNGDTNLVGHLAIEE